MKHILHEFFFYVGVLTTVIFIILFFRDNWEDMTDWARRIWRRTYAGQFREYILFFKTARKEKIDISRVENVERIIAGNKRFKTNIYRKRYINWIKEQKEKLSNENKGNI